MNGNHTSSNPKSNLKIFKVKIGDQSITVEVGDIHSRPILAIVDGVQFEVWPDDQNGVKSVARMAAGPAVQNVPGPSLAPTAPPSQSSEGAQQVLAPIPGTIISISVKPGAQVNPGDQLLVLEAMKMKNIIRATRSGTVSTLLVTTGQTVNHHDPLLEYTE
jgi:biotin carboxyl carrier protein